MYIDAYNKDPFSDKTVQLGDLILLLANERSERWKELITSTDLTHNSKKAWKNIKKLNSEKCTQARVAAVAPNQVANQLLRNGKPPNKEKGHQKRLRTKIDQAIAECDDQLEEFSLSKLRNALTFMKTGKA